MINISYAIRHIGRTLSFDTEINPPDIDGATVTNVSATGNITGLSPDTLSVTGRLFATVSQPCARCNGPAEFHVDCVFDEVFSRTAADNPDNFIFEGNQIDIEPLAECLIVLALPMRLLCKEDCKGLCPICGKDLNEMSCRHE